MSVPYGPQQPSGPGPQQPTGPQPPPQAPYGGPQPPQQPYPPVGGYQAYQQPGYGAMPPKQKRNMPLIIGLGVAVVVIAVVVGLALAGVFKGKDGAAEPAASSSDGSSAKSNDPKSLAENYLNALAEGDADKAKSLLDLESSASDVLLTKDVLADSLKRLPITDIKVEKPEDSESSASVKVSYKAGDEPVQDTYRVDVKTGKLKSGLGTMSLNLPKGLDKTINGVAVKGDVERAWVFPGSYEIKPASEYLQYKDAKPVVVRHSTDFSHDYPTLEVAQAGIDKFREKVVPEAQACLASTNLDPGCNMAIDATLSDGTVLTEGTLTRTQNEENQKKLTEVVPKVDPNNPNVLYASSLGTFEIKADCGSKGQCKVIGSGKGASWPKASIDLTDPDLKVTWTNR